MLRSAIRNSLRPLRPQTYARRPFVSTVLLSKTYEDKTVTELRTELRARGLSVSGTKQALISRIKQADVQSASEIGTTSSRAPQAAPAPSHPRRDLSNSAPREAAPAPALTPVSSPSTSSPLPPVTFDYKLPDVSQQDESGPPVQIPFVPDFWESSEKKAEEAAAFVDPLFSEPSAPKIMLAAGASTYPAGGPTYAMSPATDILPSTEPPSNTRSSTKKYDGLLGDMLDDLGVPHDILSASSQTLTENSPSQELSAKRKSFNRPLDEDERRGAITLAGLLFGAWVVAGLAAPSKGKSKKSSGH